MNNKFVSIDPIAIYSENARKSVIFRQKLPEYKEIIVTNIQYKNYLINISHIVYINDPKGLVVEIGGEKVQLSTVVLSTNVLMVLEPHMVERLKGMIVEYMPTTGTYQREVEAKNLRLRKEKELDKSKEEDFPQDDHNDEYFES